MKRKISPLIKGLCVGFILVLATVLSLIIYTVLHRAYKSSQTGSAWSVSAEQIQQIAGAISQYEKTNGRRPERLEMLVKAALIKCEAFFDDRQSKPSEIDEITGRFMQNPHVLYFPAVLKSDPGDMVLLCTITLRENGGKFQVIYNDGRHAKLDSRELIMALQKTYTYLGRNILKEQAQSESATETVSRAQPVY